MRVALYARISTSDRDQNVETQLLPLRDFCHAQGWEVHREYVDQVSANDVAHRLAWRDLLDDAAKRKFTVVLVFKLDRAFRSVKHMHDTLAAWETVGVAFKSVREQFDTSTALGRLLLNLLASLAEFELELIRERVKAGMDRARRQGRRIGRPRVTERRGFSRDFGAVLERLADGSLSRRRAARELGIGYATLKRLLDAQARQGAAWMARRDPAKKRDLKNVAKSGRQKALTSTDVRIHCVATGDAVEPENEMDKLTIDTFLDTLAEIALSVAARSKGPQP